MAPQNCFNIWIPVNLPNNSNSNCVFENKHVILEFNISNVTEQFGKYILNRTVSFDKKIGFYIRAEIGNLANHITNEIKLDCPVKISILS